MKQSSDDIALVEGDNELNVQMVPMAPPEPSATLISYQQYLVEAVESCRLAPDLLMMIPEHGLQYPCVGVGLLEGMMLTEALNIGMITSPAGVYFVEAIMYFPDGTTIVPYWWPCPYCPETFRSPAERDAHLEVAHQDILLTKATITLFEGWWITSDDPEEPDEWGGYEVQWRNDSPFEIRAHISVTASGGRDNIVPAGGYATIRLSGPQDYNVTALLTLVGGAWPGMVLARVTKDFW